MSSSRSAGFTLVEVLVAFAILVSSVAVCVAIFGRGLQTTRLTEDLQRAARVAQNRLVELGAATQLTPGIAEGLAEGDLRWRVSLVPGFLPGPPPAEGERLPGFYRVAVRVAFGDAGRDERHVTLYSVLNVPPARRALANTDRAEAAEGDETDGSGGDTDEP